MFSSVELQVFLYILGSDRMVEFTFCFLIDFDGLNTVAKLEKLSS